jgi:hypothetical protein
LLLLHRSSFEFQYVQLQRSPWLLVPLTLLCQQELWLDLLLPLLQPLLLQPSLLLPLLPHLLQLSLMQLHLRLASVPWLCGQQYLTLLFGRLRLLLG